MFRRQAHFLQGAYSKFTFAHNGLLAPRVNAPAPDGRRNESAPALPGRNTAMPNSFFVYGHLRRGSDQRVFDCGCSELRLAELADLLMLNETMTEIASRRPMQSQDQRRRSLNECVIVSVLP